MISDSSESSSINLSILSQRLTKHVDTTMRILYRELQTISRTVGCTWYFAPLSRSARRKYILSRAISREYAEQCTILFFIAKVITREVFYQAPNSVN